MLPGLVERSLERGWKAVIHAGSAERVEALTQHLWTFRDDSFLAHGTKADGHASAQPIYLTDEDDNPNGAEVLFLVDGATRADISAFERSVYIFDGRDADAVEAARKAWAQAVKDGHEVTYWRQSAEGRWEKAN